MPVLPSRTPTKLRPRVDFNMEEYRKFIFNKGVDLTWEQCSECPCSASASSFNEVAYIHTTTQTTGEARADCALCDGKGYFWHSSQTIRAIVTRQDTKQDQFALYGEYARGMVSVSTLPEHLPAYGDRFTIQASVMIYRETRTRTDQAIEKMRYPIGTRNLDLQGGVQTLRVLHIQKASSAGLSTESDALTSGVDYVVTEQGRIDFTLGDQAGTAPATGDRYSITYYASPRYYVADHPHAHRDSVHLRKSPDESPLLMPVQVNCSLEFMGTSDE